MVGWESSASIILYPTPECLHLGSNETTLSVILLLLASDSFNPEMEINEESPTGGDRDWAEEERVEFEQHLDKNRDGKLDQREIRDWLAPNEAAFFEEEARHLLSHADTDKVRVTMQFLCMLS